jgi:membrane-bound lytic murein transglycosylase F
MPMIKKSIYLILFLLILGTFTSCFQKSEDVNSLVETSQPFTTWEKIQQHKKIVAVTEYNSTDYFIYRGQPMGFHYELLQKLSDYLGMEIEIVLNNDLVDNFAMLQSGDYDLIAMNLTVTRDRSKFLDFTRPIMQTRQILVQRKPENWQKMNQREYNKQLLRSALDLSRKEVCVKKKSSYVDRLKSLSEEIGDTIYIKEMEHYTEDEIIELLANKELDYTICDENIAKVNATYYDNIDIKTPVSFSQNIAWAVPKGADTLKAYINKWIMDNVSKKWFVNLYRKYYSNHKSSIRVKSEYYSLNDSKISKYDESIKKYSKEIGWDWRLVSSLVYQESRFNPTVVSWAGAQGLMQLMPNTAKRFGVTDSSAPSKNIEAGIKFISWLDKQLKSTVKDSVERRKFVLASYNIGLGHIQDAQKLAEKNGANPALWEDNVEKYLKLKENPNYYLDSIVSYGYCRGSNACKYVKEVLDRYQEYVKVIEL